MPKVEGRVGFTSGPWAWERGDECVHADRGEVFVAWLPTVTDRRRGSDKQIEADAHLIASAPDLYAALKECREAVAVVMRVLADLDAMEGALVDVRLLRLIEGLHLAGVSGDLGVRADAALAKAEGR